MVGACAGWWQSLLSRTVSDHQKAMATVIAATITLAMVSGPVPTICPGCTPVFYPGLNGSACFRIP
jgi:hypothetical protein